jgi:hypothetical protein
VNLNLQRLSQMILDKVFCGVLDQTSGGCLEVFESASADVYITDYRPLTMPL